MARLSSKEKHEKNPFRKDVVTHTIQGISTIYANPNGSTETYAAINRVTGEDCGDIAFGKRIVVDKTDFLKLYANGVKMFLGLKSAGIKVFMIIFDALMDDKNYGKDKIILKYELLEDVQRENISETTFYRGIRELRKAKLIAPTLLDGMYWLNTDYVFRGNRLTIVNQYICDENKQIEESKKKILSRHEEE